MYTLRLPLVASVRTTLHLRPPPTRLAKNEAKGKLWRDKRKQRCALLIRIETNDFLDPQVAIPSLGSWTNPERRSPLLLCVLDW